MKRITHMLMQRHKALKFLMILLLAALVPLSGQDKKQQGKKEGGKFKIHSGGQLEDDRFEIKNFGFYKVYDTKGEGELLQATFELHNKTDDEFDFKVYTYAYNEKDAIDPLYRTRVEYPGWRKKDIEGETFGIHMFDSVPLVDKNNVQDNLSRYEHPSILKYVNYITANPDAGKPIVLMGYPKNSLSDDKDSKKSSVKIGSVTEKLPRRKEFTVSNEPLKTSVTVRLMSPYGFRYRFFSHFGVIVYSVKEQKVVLRNMLKFKNNFKVH